MPRTEKERGASSNLNPKYARLRGLKPAQIDSVFTSPSKVSHWSRSLFFFAPNGPRKLWLWRRPARENVDARRDTTAWQPYCGRGRALCSCTGEEEGPTVRHLIHRYHYRTTHTHSQSRTRVMPKRKRSCFATATASLGLALIIGVDAMHPQPPAWLVSRFETVDGGGTCTGPLQCNGVNCYDCACKNSKCACGGGFSGPHCETAFCVNRTHGCSGHGDCVQTLQNMSCSCDKYYTGPHCETAECQLDCKHGSVPNSECTQCVGCMGAWTGKLCDVWDKKVPVQRLMSKLYEISNASQKMLDGQKKFNPICKQGHECVGWGIGGVSGKPTQFPVVSSELRPFSLGQKI